MNQQSPISQAEEDALVDAFCDMIGPQANKDVVRAAVRDSAMKAADPKQIELMAQRWNEWATENPDLLAALRTHIKPTL